MSLCLHNSCQHRYAPHSLYRLLWRWRTRFVTWCWSSFSNVIYLQYQLLPNSPDHEPNMWWTRGTNTCTLLEQSTRNRQREWYHIMCKDYIDEMPTMRYPVVECKSSWIDITVRDRMLQTINLNDPLLLFFHFFYFLLKDITNKDSPDK